MKGWSAIIGLLTALLLPAAGLILLPEPELSSRSGLFSAIWMLVAMASAVAFGREVMLKRQVSLIRKRMRRSAGSKLKRSPADTGVLYARGEIIRQRARQSE
ncbi:MAG: hypothetical protein KGZ32_05890 [Dethiobacter sp.]|jgi:hypothetical protein|nr:hypothetical protein [Dethiobacter sp.]